MMKRLFTSVLIVVFAGTSQAISQGYGVPLTMQGVNQTLQHSVASQSTGGTLFLVKDDISLMFSNPVSLQSLSGIRVSVGGFQQSSDAIQSQQWFPLRYLPNFSLLMEGYTGLIPNPDPSKPGTQITGADDSVQRPYDAIGPNWTRSQRRVMPHHAFVAAPLSIGEFNLVAGAGLVQYADLNYYFQNNNVLSPSIGNQRPYGFPAPDVSTLVRWSQYVQNREGSIWGYGGAISAAFSEKLSFGVSGMILRGKSDDHERTLGRGNLTFFNTGGTYFFRLDSTSYVNDRTGTSEFSGEEFTVSGIYKGHSVSLGFSLKPPSTIVRTTESTVTIDSMKAHSSVLLSRKDELTIPWRATIGLSVSVRSDLQLGIDYEIRPFASAEYTDANGKKSNPWSSSSLIHVGAEYAAAPWLLLRGGFRDNAEVFEPEGNALLGDPVRYSTYSVGCGLTFSIVHLDFGYEYSQVKFSDAWSTNVNVNKKTSENLVVALTLILD